MEKIYFEDLPVGAVLETGARTLTREAIVGFAREWDPQPFHLDDAAAEASPYGALIASGWHTLLTAFTLALEARDWSQGSMGSPGMDEVRWLKPVYAGDTIRAVGHVLEARVSRSKPDRGFATMRYDIFNQKDERVAHYSGLHMLRLRPQAE
ncbi:MaoC family dehydratase [Thalassococcus sp. S3]|uniref:MaoC family dehydratase n=1 Tax=Thalassococcus sp. S3 TaxID=2017482 RepID=UPI0010246F95|nr:MaoC family dehydratase [Thalassococcus sp. S3]QBF30761.1 acyl dehydratase [Thalassococcus sp. S3]